MRFVLIALLAYAALYAIRASRVFDTFNKGIIVSSAFEMDLSSYIKTENTSYSDGFLQFHHIDETHPLYIRYFSKPYEMTFHISFLHETIETNKGPENIRFRRINNGSDGYVPVVAYDPELRILVFGYSNGIGG
jgi:hypothetical protein